MRQTDAKRGEKPLEWLLLSTLGDPRNRWAQQIVRWYEARWGIEEFFRVLKSGAHRGPPPADGARAAELPGVRRHHGLAGVLAGRLRTRCAGHA